MAKNKSSDLPLVYSCSGCSSAAQMANYIAVRLDRTACAEMSCIAGVGGDVKPLVRTAVSASKTGRHVIAIDGCRLQCVKRCLERHDMNPDKHYILSDYGIKKKMHSDFDKREAELMLEKVKSEATEVHSNAEAEQ